MTDTEVVEAVVVDEETAPPVEAPAPGAQLAIRPATRDVLMPLDTERVIEGMAAYQQMLPRLLDTSDYQDAGDGKRFVKKSGFRKIARAFNLSTAIVHVTVDRDDHGNPIRAEAIVRAIAPNGQIQDGDGYCSADESRFSKAAGRKKLENDLRATATTRAKNRAISDLVGMGEVSAEEIGPLDGPPEWAGLIDETSDQAKACRGALGQLVGAENAMRLYEQVRQDCHGIPTLVAQLILDVYDGRAQ